MSHPLMLVRWLDAHVNDSPADLEAIQRKPIGIERVSVGFLARRDDTGIVLAMSRDPDGEFDTRLSIPARYIIDEPQPLTVKRQRKAKGEHPA